MDVALVLCGVLVSMIISAAKKNWKLDKTQTMSLVVILSFAGGIAFFLLKQYGLWESLLQILMGAGAFYAFILKNLSK